MENARRFVKENEGNMQERVVTHYMKVDLA